LTSIATRKRRNPAPFYSKSEIQRISIKDLKYLKPRRSIISCGAIQQISTRNLEGRFSIAAQSSRFQLGISKVDFSGGAIPRISTRNLEGGFRWRRDPAGFRSKSRRLIFNCD
jgi:hypothetical protein